MDWRDAPCKIWTGAHTMRGYGRRWRNGHVYLNHRLAYMDAYGPIPDEIKVLHHCDNPACYEATHLFLGTQKDNIDDMMEKGRHYQQSKTHCKHGHEFTPENTHVITRANGTSRRSCRICERIQHARYHAKADVRERDKAYHHEWKLRRKAALESEATA